MMATKRKFYAVKSGDVPGIYDSWEACKQQVQGFKGNQYKSFPTLAEAEQYMISGAGSVMKVEGAKEIQKRSPPERNAVSASSSVFDMLGPDPSGVRPADPTRKGKSSSAQASFMLPAQVGDDDVSNIDPNALYRLEYDGASKGNPGHAGAGALLRNPHGSVVCEMSVGLGKTTNNVAEYRGLIAGLKKARELGIQRIQAQGDSKLVTQQLRGVWAVKNENLAVLCKEAKELVKSFNDFEIRHVDREWNSAADVLANKGVGLPEEKLVSVFVEKQALNLG